MSCTNCFNGCTETVSDKCVKYTGIDVPALGISNGDTLLSVEQAIISFLVPVLTGVGVKPVINESYICEVVSQYLPTCTQCNGFTLNEVLTAIIRATCDIQNQVTQNTNAIATLNANYTIGCLTGVTSSSDTHDIVQAVINNLCNLNSAFTTLLLTLPTTYVSIANINSYIAAYLDSQNFLELAKDRMIPYAPQPYFGPLSNFPATGDNFSLTGAGTGYWNKVYLCNGQNGTPDLRGRTLVGVTTGMGGSAYDPEVDPAIVGNPNYTISGGGSAVNKYGANFVTLNVGQIPNHTHIAVVTDPEHSHDLNPSSQYSTRNDPPESSVNYLMADPTSFALYNANVAINDQDYIKPAATGISVNIQGTGGGGSHNNVQPSRASYYIMYIP
jgi:microcystin-dependent protein